MLNNLCKIKHYVAHTLRTNGTCSTIVHTVVANLLPSLFDQSHKIENIGPLLSTTSSFSVSGVTLIVFFPWLGWTVECGGGGEVKRQPTLNFPSFW